MSNNITKNEINILNQDYADNSTLFLDFNEYKFKHLEKKNLLDCYINDNKISDKEKIIHFLESEFYFLEEQQKAIFYSNEEMKKYSTEDDEEINECRSENMKILFKNLERMKKIKSEILDLDRTHYIKDRDLLLFYKKLDQEVKGYNNKDFIDNPFIKEFIDRSGTSDYSDNDNKNKANKSKEERIISEISL